MALSIGVIITWVSFLIKVLGPLLTETKRADLEISRRLFERILTLLPMNNDKRQVLWLVLYVNLKLYVNSLIHQP